MLFQVDFNGSGFVTIDTEHLNYDFLCNSLGLKKDWEKKAVKRVIQCFDNSDPDLKDNDHYKTIFFLMKEAGECILERLIEAEVLKRNIKFINRTQQPVYGLNPKKLYELSDQNFF
jgi:hypothetical protein